MPSLVGAGLLPLHRSGPLIVLPRKCTTLPSFVPLLPVTVTGPLITLSPASMRPVLFVIFSGPSIVSSRARNDRILTSWVVVIAKRESRIVAGYRTS